MGHASTTWSNSESQTGCCSIRIHPLRLNLYDNFAVQSLIGNILIRSVGRDTCCGEHNLPSATSDYATKQAEHRRALIHTQPTVANLQGAALFSPHRYDDQPNAHPRGPPRWPPPGRRRTASSGDAPPRQVHGVSRRGSDYGSREDRPTCLLWCPNLQRYRRLPSSQRRT